MARCQTLSPSVRGELPEKMAVNLVSKFIPFILGNTDVNTSVLLGVKMSTPRQPYVAPN